ncbi:MAG: GNAT family N-acetyltransferase [Actinobacteria bacterium]|nr:GNAT family N-acetyltransferase [Actinomycetota bacterium]MDA8186292.1 hypothetical protein [Actinomycetota bacterium]
MPASLGKGDEVYSPPSHSRQGRFVTLQPVRRHHQPFLFWLTMGDDSGARWRFRGVVPREEVFERLLWEGVLTQLLVERRTSGEPVGLASAYAADLVGGTVRAAVVLTPAATGRGLGVEVLMLFARHLFDTWRIRKIYLEAPGFTCGQFHSAIGRYLHEEACLRDDELADGRFWDTSVLALYPDDLRHFEQRFGLFYARRPLPTNEPTGNGGGRS